MTDKIKGFWVALDHDMREDDAQKIIDAVLCIKNVIDVCVSVKEARHYN